LFRHRGDSTFKVGYNMFGYRGHRAIEIARRRPATAARPRCGWWSSSSNRPKVLRLAACSTNNPTHARSPPVPSP